MYTNEFAVTTYTYDTKGRLLSTTNPEGKTTTHSYKDEWASQPTETILPNGARITFEYDKLGRKLS